MANNIQYSISMNIYVNFLFNLLTQNISKYEYARSFLHVLMHASVHVRDDGGVRVCVTLGACEYA